MGQTRSISYDALLTMTADNYYKAGVIHDGVFESNPTFKELNKKGLKKVDQGGGKIQVNIMSGENSTVDSYSRYGLIDTAPQDGFEPAFYDWCQYAGTVAIDGLSEFQNSGAPRIQALLREKVKQLTMSFSQRMNKDLWDAETITTATGNGGKNIIPITHYVQGSTMAAGVTAGLDVGGIDQSANSWWQNRYLNSVTETAATKTFSNLNKELRNLYNTCGRGEGGTPNIMIASQDVFEAYENGMDEKTRYSMSDDASVGFENIKFKGAKLFWDYHVPDPVTPYNYDNSSYAATSQGAVYFLNTNFLDLVCGKGKDFAPLGFQKPVGQDARVGEWVFYGQLVCSNRRKLGVLEDITSVALS